MKQLEKLVKTMSDLRNTETGCAWDLKQTHHTLIPYLIEESYEVIDAIETTDDEHLREELGDLLFQIVFHAQIAEEQGRFNFAGICSGINEKLVRRHPHVFAGVVHESDEAREADWADKKKQERKEKVPSSFTLSGIPQGLPSLMRSQKLQRRAAGVGFDWEHAEQVIPKIREELAEVEEAVKLNESPERVEEELGDLLFAVVNYARKLGVDSENALRKGNLKFERRFNAVEQQVAAQGQKMEASSQAQLEVLWEAVKQQEKNEV